MANTLGLRFTADTDSGTIVLAEGRAMLGSIHEVSVIVDKVAATAEHAYKLMVYAFENQPTPLCVDHWNVEKGTLAFGLQELRDAFRPNSKAWETTIPLSMYLYKVDANDNANVIAEGSFPLTWVPLFGVSVTGQPITVRGPQGLTGAKGDKGDIYEPSLRVNGDSVFLDFTNTTTGAILPGTVNLKGETGASGVDGVNGARGPQGIAGAKGDAGADGVTYTPVVRMAETGVYLDFVSSADASTIAGTVNIKGADGTNGVDGADAYEVAQQAGYTGTREAWYALLSGLPGLISQQSATIEQAKTELTRLANTTATNADVCSRAVTKVTNAMPTIDHALAAVEGFDDTVNDATTAINAKVTQSETSATSASTSATQAETAKDATVAIKDEFESALDIVDNAESVMLKKANVIDFMPVVQYIGSYFNNDVYLTFAGFTQLDNGDFIVASAKYGDGVNGKLLVFFQFNQQLELVHKIEVTLVDSIYGNYYGHFLVVDGVLNHIIRGIRREFALDVEGKISLGNTYTIDASALGVNPWDTSLVDEVGETQAFALGNYIVYEKFVLNKNTNIVESVLANRITSVTAPTATIEDSVWFVANKKVVYKATVDSEGAISFTRGISPVATNYSPVSIRSAYTMSTTNSMLTSALCGAPNFQTGDNAIYNVLWGFTYGIGTATAFFSPNIFNVERVTRESNFTANKNNLFLFDSMNKMFHLFLGRSAHYKIREYALEAHRAFGINQQAVKIISSNSKGILCVARTSLGGYIASADFHRGFQQINRAYYIPWEQE